MRKRIRLLAAVGIALLGLYLWTTSKVSKEQAQKVSVEPYEPTTQHPAVQRVARSVPATEPKTNAPPRPVASKPSRSELIDYAMQQANQPISFYGKVVDQNDAPIAGARIRMRYTEHLLVGGTYGENNQPVDLETDTGGRFELTGVKGSRINIESIGKSGYQLSPKALLTPAPYSNPTDPIIFRMWKRQGADRLVTGDKFYGIVPDGRIYTIDLLAHKKTEGRQASGDLQVWIQRSKPAEPKGKFDWAFGIDAVRGGIIESTNELMYLAPESGYQEHYEVHMKASDPSWWPRAKKQFFLKSRNEIYSRLDVEVIPDYTEKGIFSVKYFVNPTGSRNLEYDSRQMISTDNFFPPQ